MIVIGIAAALGAAFLAGSKLHRQVALRSPAEPIPTAPQPPPTPPPMTVLPPPSPPTAPMIAAIPAAMPTSAAPSPADPIPVTRRKSGDPRPPVPTDLNPNLQTMYGLVYDLGTREPVAGMRLHFQPVTRWNGSASLSVQTDEHGWYKLMFPPGVFADGGEAIADPPTDIVVMMKDGTSPLRSRSAGYRRTIYEAATCTAAHQRFSLQAGMRVMELDLAAVRREWPAGMPAAEVLAATAPPAPEPETPPNCKIYGMVYDLATKAALRCVRLSLDANLAGAVATDERGHYSVTANQQQLANGVLHAGPIPGFRPGLMADQDPPLFNLGVEKRREIAERLDGAFDAVSLSYDCPNGIRRVDLFAVPKSWPRSH